MSKSLCIFRGKANSIIYFDEKEKKWKLQSLRDPSKYLLLKHKNPRVYPIGTHTWALGSDNAICAKKKQELIKLSLSICYPNKYTCNNGGCIDLRLVFL